MNIEFEVTGGTHKTVKATLNVNGTISGELSMNREDFTKFCDILFPDHYIIKSKTNSHGHQSSQ